MTSKNPLDKIRDKKLPSSSLQGGRTGTPVWKGPEVDGVTQSLLGRFLVCRHRFYLLVVEGLKPSEGWNHRTGYGDMWHVCEEGQSKGYGMEDIVRVLQEFTQGLVARHPFDRQKIEHWFMVCRTQFPIYIKHWNKHPDNLVRTPLLQEEKFKVRYRLPSGRTILLRGKWDAVDLIREDVVEFSGKGGEEPRNRKTSSGIWLQENKTKGDVDSSKLARQLTFDLQTMFYLVALGIYQVEKDQYRLGGEGIPRGVPILGVRYNVVRRPLSGGKGSITRHKATKSKPAETSEAFYFRLGDIIREEPDHFFARWKSTVTARDVETFKVQCLNPVLEQLCDWWEMVTTKGDPFSPSNNKGHSLHFRFPYGVYNPMTEGTASDYDAYLETGSTVGLRRTDDLFPELKGK